MIEPTWLTLEDIDVIVRAIEAEFPGHFIELYPHKIGDLEAGLHRARNKWAFEYQSDLMILAAEHAFGIGKAHAFGDGNKRICFLAATLFLQHNGVDLVEPEPRFFAQPIKDLMANLMTVDQLAELFEPHATLIDDDEH
ncbi:type II toxin-antitoxin system death-on-curing family toxin [Stappia sp. P2PMeth1]|uniref:type II toxin-antitoxin system death-on-curing family toxin n=1 Tax=Stappia sp. P2PMeth1 TaxID=2003586 RepID=UPI001646906D|nr:Fic family protein [Stappia sp. P2PMeth1]